MLEFVVMREADGNQTIAAEMLGINRNTLRASSSTRPAVSRLPASASPRPAPPFLCSRPIRS
jgi:hypothetical protein